MHWNSASEFFAMGGYAFYVWGSYGVALLVFAVEIAMVRPVHDLSGLIGQKGEAKTAIEEEGSVQVAGELWSARSEKPVPTEKTVPSGSSTSRAPMSAERPRVGATICLARAPRCEVCPLRPSCVSAADDPKAAAPHREARALGRRSADRGSAPFPTTRRWLRGRILDRQVDEAELDRDPDLRHLGACRSDAEKHERSGH